MTAQPFDLTCVRLLDGAFKAAMERDAAYLLQLDPDRLLHTFYLNAGLPTTAQPYGGWEDPKVELRGHFAGHYVTACALMYASTGDDRFKARVDHMVAGFAAVQAALPSQGYNSGYLSAFPESYFDRVEGRFPVWAPYYTLHKIMAGLLDAHLHCSNPQALPVLERCADWVKLRVDNLTYEQMQITLLMEFGGMNEVFANLYGVTKNPEHLRLSIAFNDDVVLDPLKQGSDQMDRLHANTQIPKLIGLARQYELTGDTVLRDAAKFFWERVAHYRSYVIGGHSDDELFFPVHRFADHLTSVSAETCNTYNMLKLTRHLFAWEPSAEAMDFYERGLFNHILASQDPETGMMLYFCSLKPGHVKVYSAPEHSFWCCTGTGVENHAKYADTIYYHADDALYVNLFIASELTWDARQVTVRQETQFPDSDTTHLTLRCAQTTRFALKLRCPAWATGASIQINGVNEPFNVEPGSYISLDREWHDGDQIDLRLPMRLHAEPLPGAADHIALLYGPIVLAGALGTENMPNVYLEDPNTRNAAVNWHPAPPVPPLQGSAQSVLEELHPVAGQPLTYQLSGVGLPHAVQILPFYKLHHQRYTVYWQLT
jgi:DUF1680 family protein